MLCGSFQSCLTALTSSMRGDIALFFGHKRGPGAGNDTFKVIMRQSTTAAL